MYKKLIKRGSKTYSYYYHNYRKGGQVKNVFLGDNLKQAKLNLNKFNSLNQAPIPNRQTFFEKKLYQKTDKNPGYSGAILVALFLLVLGIGFFFFKPEITGLTTDNLIQTDAVITKESGIITIQSGAAPTQPTSLQPTNDSFILDTTPNLNWTNSTDGEADILTYNLDIATNSNFATIVYSTSAITSGPSPTGHNVTTTLNFTNYYFRVRADDGTSNGTYAYGNFTIAYHPSFISMLSYPTYITVNRTQTANITIRLNQSTNASFTNLTIKDPNGINVNLTSTNTTVIGSTIYEYNFTFTPKAVGTYNLTFTLNDTAFPTTNSIQRNATLYSVQAESVNFTAPGSQRITVKDILTKEILYQGTNSSILSNITLTSFPPGQYYLDIHSSDNKSFVIFGNATLNSTINETLNYTDVGDTLTLPVAGTTNINQFTLATNLSFVDANITYYYGDNLSQIEHEESLAIFKCASNDSCSWVRLNRTIYENQNNLTTVINSFSVFNLIDQSPLNITTTTTTTGGGGGGGGTVTADISIIQPSPITLFKDDTTIALIIIKNNGEKTLNDIRINVNAGNQPFRVEVNPTSIPVLTAGQQASVDLTITNIGLEEGDYEITVRAGSTSPALTDEAKFFINVVPKYIIAKKNAEEQLIFVENLFNKNPACLELSELIQKSKIEFNNEEYAKSLELANSAIESCKNLLSREGKELILPKRAEPLSDTIMLMLEIIAFLFVFILIYNYYRKWRFKKNLRKR